MKKKKSGKNIFDEYRSLKDDIVSELIRETFKKHPDAPFTELEKLGFNYVLDEYDCEEIKAENVAAPENINQEFLMAFFEGHVECTEAVLGAYNTEKNATSPNYPLLRKPFRQGNPALKTLLLLGLDKNPTDTSLLHDLAFFHEHHGVLSELISRYRTACCLEKDLLVFSELAMDFYYNTVEDGFEALYDLEQLCQDNPGKSEVVAQLILEHTVGDAPAQKILS